MRAALDALEKKRISSLYLELNRDSSIGHPLMHYCTDCVAPASDRHYRVVLCRCVSIVLFVICQFSGREVDRWTSLSYSSR
jgi:hypothetical protein